MPDKYKPKAPSSYPIRWNRALQDAAGSPGLWFVIDDAETPGGALNRMSKLRCFRDGFSLFPGDSPRLARALHGMVVHFRKRARKPPFGDTRPWVVEVMVDRDHAALTVPAIESALRGDHTSGTPVK